MSPPESRSVHSRQTHGGTDGDAGIIPDCSGHSHPPRPGGDGAIAIAKHLHADEGCELHEHLPAPGRSTSTCAYASRTSIAGCGFSARVKMYPQRGLGFRPAGVAPVFEDAVAELGVAAEPSPTPVGQTPALRRNGFDPRPARSKYPSRLLASYPVSEDDARSRRPQDTRQLCRSASVG